MNTGNYTGNLVEDPKPIQTKTGVPMCVARVALAKSKEAKEDETTFIDIKSFKWSAEDLQACRKGQRIKFEAEPKEDNWLDQQGQKRSKMTFIVIGAIGICPQREQPKQAPQYQAPVAQQTPVPQYQTQSPAAGETGYDPWKNGY